jgi:hypothetical protein
MRQLTGEQWSYVQVQQKECYLICVYEQTMSVTSER